MSLMFKCFISLAFSNSFSLSSFVCVGVRLLASVNIVLTIGSVVSSIVMVVRKP
jgi:hypothetical protein